VPTTYYAGSREEDFAGRGGHVSPLERGRGFNPYCSSNPNLQYAKKHGGSKLPSRDFFN